MECCCNSYHISASFLSQQRCCVRMRFVYSIFLHSLLFGCPCYFFIALLHAVPLATNTILPCAVKFHSLLFFVPSSALCGKWNCKILNTHTHILHQMTISIAFSQSDSVCAVCMCLFCCCLSITLCWIRVLAGWWSSSYSLILLLLVYCLVFA